MLVHDEKQIPMTLNGCFDIYMVKIGATVHNADKSKFNNISISIIYQYYLLLNRTNRHGKQLIGNEDDN